ncbi:hypothetical protein JCM5353_004342 [Sporobolomyces roseus]
MTLPESEDSESKVATNTTTSSDQPQTPAILAIPALRLISSSSSSASSTTPTTFTFAEALDNPTKYREFVTRAVWEEEVNLPHMKDMYHPDTAPVIQADGRKWRSLLDEVPSHNLFGDGRQIARLHYRISQVALSEEGWFFERRWNDMSEETRAKKILKALDSTMRKIGPTALTSRWFCPDVTVETMVKNGGFLPLVRYITRSGRTHKGKDFDVVISPQVDRRSGVKRGSEGIPYDRAARHMQIFIEHSRDFFISIFVLLVLLDHFDTERLFPNGFDSILAIAHQKARLLVPEAETWMRAGLVDERDVQGLIEMETACGLPQTNNDAERVCAEKRKGKEEKWALNDSPSKSRLVLYPKNLDWKDGHKLLCGKLFEAIAFKYGQITPPVSPPPSIPLQWQLYSPDRPEGVDGPRPYIFFRFTPGAGFDTRPIPGPLVSGIREFLLQAFRTGSKSHKRIFITYAAMASYAPLEGEGNWREAIARQSSQEWDLDYDEVYGWLSPAGMRNSDALMDASSRSIFDRLTQR